MGGSGEVEEGVGRRRRWRRRWSLLVKIEGGSELEVEVGLYVSSFDVM